MKEQALKQWNNLMVIQGSPVKKIPFQGSRPARRNHNSPSPFSNPRSRFSAPQTKGCLQRNLRVNQSCLSHWLARRINCKSLGSCEVLMSSPNKHYNLCRLHIPYVLPVPTNTTTYAVCTFLMCCQVNQSCLSHWLARRINCKSLGSCEVLMSSPNKHYNLCRLHIPYVLPGEPKLPEPLACQTN
ncbi:hypothetical protein J6590_067724 [Homalodisca vitripennis]|nr:hypothetical protein J6590_067724 [Homalodisca vitripennis]